jgi:hypothetical protein
MAAPCSFFQLYHSQRSVNQKLRFQAGRSASCDPPWNDSADKGFDKKGAGKKLEQILARGTPLKTSPASRQ